MKKLLRLFMLTALLLPFALKAQNTLTVADGTTTNSYVPVYGLYVDDYVRCQTIYPAGMLDAAAVGFGMTGGTITGLTYYLSSPATDSWGAAQFEVVIKEVTATTLSAFLDITDATTVYAGSLDGTQSTMNITFTTPYTYQGGNLLVEIHSTAEGTYKSASFYGVEATGASWQGYSSSSWSAVSGATRAFIPKTTFTFTGGSAITCSPVQNLAVDAAQITSSSMTLTWTDAINTGATYTVYNMADNSVVQSGITANTYTVTGLTANTAYTFGVEANCSATDASSVLTTGGRTACAAQSLPWTCGFESDELQGTTNALGIPWCSERYVSAATSGTTYPYSSTSYPHSGSRSLYIYGTTSTSYPDTMALILPQVDVTTYPMNANRMTFWARSSSTSYDKKVYIYSLNDVADITSATLLDSVLVTGTTHVKYSVPLIAAPATNAYLAIMVKKGSGSLYMDDVTIEEMPACLEVNNLTVTATTANSVSLSWVDAVNASATYTIYNMADSSVVGTATTTTYTIDNLTPYTTYNFGVQANCSAGDAPITTVTATTDCSNEETMPWSENFDNWTAKSPCWMFLSGLLSQGAPTVSSSAWTLNSTYGNYITLSGKALTMNLYSANRYWAVTPPINITSNNAMLSVDVAVSAWSAAEPNYDENDTLAFLLTTDTGATFTLLQVIDYNQLNALGNTYTTLYIPVTGYNGQAVRFAIYGGSVSGTSPYDNRIAIDNVAVGEASACMPVTNLAASDVTAYGATLTWQGDAAGYTIYNMADTSVLQTTTDTTVVINTLNPDTPYTLGVQANCGNDQSVIVTVNITTLVTCPAPTNLEVTLTPGNGTVASLSWNEIGTAQAWQICLNGDTNNLIDVTTNPYNLTGLTAEQAYTAQVRSYCDVNDQSAWSNLVNFTPTNAYTVTLNDGTTTNSYVPIYGLWVDDITKSQFIIPAANLTAMQFGNITKLTFYSSNTSVNWGAAAFNVYLTETNETTVSDLADYSTMTQVYAGTLAISNNIMEVTFTTPYTYMGGNLMIGFLQTVSGTYSSCNWYGVEATGASMGGYGTSISQRNFLPKTTIDYTPGTQPACMPVTNLAVSNATASGVTLTWSDENNSGATYTIYDMADTSVVATGVTTMSYDVTGLTSMTGYTFGVVANCSATETSNMALINATTACSGTTCNITIVGADSYGDGWNGNAINVMQGGAVIGTFTLTTGSSLTETFTVCSDAPVSFSWVAGSYANETSFEILDGGNGSVHSVADGSTLTSGAVFFTLTNACPSCLPATALTVDTVTENSITISWTGTAASYDVYNGSTFVANVTTTSYTFTGLNPSTSYTLGVQAICSATDSASLVTVNAATECGVITTYPYVQDFTTAPSCWMILDADGDGNNWILYQGTIQSASYSGGALNPDNWLISPQFAIPATGNYEVTWTATAQDQSWPAEHYGVFVSTTGYSDTANFTMLQEWTLGTGIFNPVIDLSNYAGQNIYIALRHFNCTDQFRLSIDDFIVREQAGANQVTINAGPNNPAYGTVAGAGIYTIGDNVTLTATANSGYTFAKWVDENNTILSTNNPYTFVAATDLNLTAIFLNDAGTTYVITVQVNDSTMGTAVGGGTYTAGDQITLTATPFSGYSFVNWTQVSGFGTNVVGTDPNLIITVTSDKTFVANFELGSGPVVTDPTVATGAATAVGTTTATLNATITNPDDVTITAKGFEWKATVGGTYTQVAGTGTGNTFTADLTGLDDNTSYTYKAFITFNGTTVYGEEMTFSTEIVGIENHLDASVVLYPNPAREYVDIRIDGNVNVTAMEVYDVYGKLISTVNVIDNPTRINVNGLANGMYFVRVTTEQGAVTKTFVKK